MIQLLYKASQAGVKIRLIIRGMFTLQPGLPGISENIKAIRLVDKYLEHARVLLFCNGGNEKCFIASADWMPRNLDRRVEVACPILDASIRQELKDILELQWRDNAKTTRFGVDESPNDRPKPGRRRAQVDIAAYLREKNR
jgi:polyphosphate kinase